MQSTELISPQQARQRLRRGLGGHAAILDEVDESLLPTSIEMKLAPGVASLLRLHPAFERLRRSPSVQEIEFGGGAAQLTSLATLSDRAQVALLALATLVVALLLFGHARARRKASEEETSIYTLVGASRAFVEAPLVIASALSGLFAAALGLLALYGVSALVVDRFDPSLLSLLGESGVGFLSGLQVGSVLVGALLLGALAGKAATLFANAQRI